MCVPESPQFRARPFFGFDVFHYQMGVLAARGLVCEKENSGQGGIMKIKLTYSTLARDKKLTKL